MMISVAIYAISLIFAQSGRIEMTTEAECVRWLQIHGSVELHDRGYAVELWLDDNTDEICDQISRLPKVYKLRLAGHQELSEKASNLISSFKDLEDLCFETPLPNDDFYPKLLEMKSLRRLGCSFAMTNKGLEAVGKLTNLVKLDVHQTKITDEGLRHLGGLKDLVQIDMSSTAVSRNLSVLKNAQKLEKLSLEWTLVDNVGLAEIAGMQQLRDLSIGYTKVTDGCMETLRTLPNLRDLSLRSTKITSQTVVELPNDLPKIEILFLDDVKIDETGLEALSAMKSLRSLFILNAGLNRSQLLSLHSSLPHCDIDTEVSMKSDDEIWLETYGDIVQRERGIYVDLYTRGENADEICTRIARLPSVNYLILHGLGALSQEGVDDLVSLKDLEKLRLESDQLTDAFFERLAEMKSLRYFYCSAPMTNKGLEFVCKMTNLTDLTLIGTKITDEGLHRLAGMQNLVNFTMHGAPIKRNLGVFRQLPKLESLNLEQTEVDDVGIAELGGMQNLRELYLGSTKVSDRCIADLRSLPNLKKLSFRSSTNITNLCLVDVKDWLPNLEFLLIEDLEVNETGLQALCGMKSLKRLWALNIGLNKSQDRFLQSSLPDCEIIASDPIDEDVE